MKKIIKSFFYSKNDFQPIYFYTFLLMIIFISMLILRVFFKAAWISDSLILQVMGMVGGLLGLYKIKLKGGKGELDKPKD